RRILMNRNKMKAKKSLYQTITKMVPAVFTALVATGLGFVALYTSPVPMIQDFGKMLTIGLVISFFLGIFLLIPILFTRDFFFNETTEEKQPRKQKKKHSNGKSDKFLEWVTKKSIRFRWVIITIAVITASFGIWVDLDADAETDVETFMPQDTQELKDIHHLRDIIGTTDQISIVYEGEDILSDSAITWIDDLTETIGVEFQDVVVETTSITNIVKQMNDDELPNGEPFREHVLDMPEDQRKLFLNESETKGVITVGTKHLEAEDLKVFIHKLNYYLGEKAHDSIETTVTGKAAL